LHKLKGENAARICSRLNGKTSRATRRWLS
jgi:hypothetical protein